MADVNEKSLADVFNPEAWPSGYSTIETPVYDALLAISEAAECGNDLLLKLALAEYRRRLEAHPAMVCGRRCAE